MKKMIRNKIISMLLVIVTLTTAILPIIQTKVKAADGVVDYKGSVSYGGSTVGKFYVNGRIAFCLEHKKDTPPTGREVTSEIYTNSKILKCLYYGWEGEEQWHFESEEQGIVYTSLALDHFKNGNANNVAKEFINYVDSMPGPQTELNFTKNNLNTQIEENIQKTQSTSMYGSPSLYITIPLQDGVTLVNETKGTRSTGNVNVYGGDSFHLEAPLNITGSWKSNPINNHRYQYQAIIYRTQSLLEQDLISRYEVAVDNSSSIRLYVNWISAGGLEIYKKDEETQEAINNTKFEIKDEEENLVETIITDEKGYAKSSNLPVGTYSLIEKTANDKYILDSSPRTVDIVAGKTITVDITNKHQNGSLKIVKVDSRDNKIPISNVTFEIWNMELNKKVATETTGKDGMIKLDNLRTGTYKVKEISSNEWYELNSKEKIVEVNANEEATLTIENDVKKGYIEVIKEDAEFSNIKLKNVKFEVKNSKGVVIETLITDENGHAKSKALPLNDTYTVKEIGTNNEYLLSPDEKKVNFAIEDNGKTKTLKFTNKHKEGSIKVVKVDEDNNKIGIGGIEFDLYSEEFKKIIGRYVTNRDGEIYINNLRTGKYKLKEVSTNKWYELAQDTEVVVEENKTKEVMIQNELKKGRIKVIKVDKDNNEIKIPNVTFEIQDKNGNVLETIVTDGKGEAITKEYPIRDYPILRIHEIETNEYYVLNNNMLQISLDENQTKSIKIENEKKKGQVKVIKLDKDNKEIKLKNVEFEVLDEAGNIVDTIVTNEKGEAVTKMLPIGQKYTIRETKTAEGYELMEEKLEVTMEYNKTKEIIIQNEKKKGQIEIYKTDAENNMIKIENVEFEVINSNNEVVEIIKTDKNGHAITSKLPIGEYIIKEIKTNDDYVLKDETIKVEITEDVITKLDITNSRKKGQIRIIKTSKDDNFINEKKAGSPISGVKFEIYDENRKLVDTVITNEEGIAISKKIDKGEYIVKEVEAGEWYLLNAEEFFVSINENEQIIDLNITDESQKPDVDIEKTGDIKAEPNQEIKYNFTIRNTGNVFLNNLTWYDYLPTKYVTLTKIYTGTYNEDLNYSVYYRTNKNDYKLISENFNTQINNCIDFSDIKLEEGEIITEFKFVFERVDVGFETVINPEVYVKAKNNIEGEIVNETRVEGDNNGYIVWKADDHITTIEKKKLPRTGF